MTDQNISEAVLPFGGMITETMSDSPVLNFRSSADGISLIIPAYNEQDRISKALDGYLPILESFGIPFEVLVVVDGNDATAEIVNRYSPRKTKAYKFNKRLGKGGAIKAGFNISRYNIVGYVDSDGSLAPCDLKKLLENLAVSDCAIASRWIKGSVWIKKEPLPKILASRLFNVLVRGMLGIPIYDTQCGAKFYRRNVLQDILHKVTVTNLTTDVDFLYHARRSGAKIIEVPVNWEDDRRSKFSMIKMVSLMFITVIGIRMMNLPLRKYIPLSLVTLFNSKFGNQ